MEIENRILFLKKVLNEFAKTRNKILRTALSKEFVFMRRLLQLALVSYNEKYYTAISL